MKYQLPLPQFGTQFSWHHSLKRVFLKDTVKTKKKKKKCSSIPTQQRYLGHIPNIHISLGLFLGLFLNPIDLLDCFYTDTTLQCFHSKFYNVFFFSNRASLSTCCSSLRLILTLIYPFEFQKQFIKFHKNCGILFVVFQTALNPQKFYSQVFVLEK